MCFTALSIPLKYFSANFRNVKEVRRLRHKEGAVMKYSSLSSQFHARQIPPVRPCLVLWTYSLHIKKLGHFIQTAMQVLAVLHDVFDVENVREIQPCNRKKSRRMLPLNDLASPLQHGILPVLFLLSLTQNLKEV